MSMLTYTRYELLRVLRNRRFFILSLGFPLLLFFLIAGPNRNVHDFAKTGLPFALYYMVGMVAFGTMGAMLSCGARIAAERAVAQSGVPFTLLRPVLVYGPGVKGNLRALMRLAALPIPLPFGALGRMVHALMVRRDVETIFEFRRKRLEELMGK